MNKADSIKESYGSYVVNALKNYNRTKAEIENLKLAIEEISIENDGVDAINYDGIKTSPTHKISRMIENLAISNINKKEWYKRELRKKVIELRKIDNALEVLDERSRKIIRMYYIDDFSMKDIAAKINLVIPYCSTLKQKGLKEIENLMF